MQYFAYFGRVNFGMCPKIFDRHAVTLIPLDDVPHPLFGYAKQFPKVPFAHLGMVLMIFE